MAAVADELDATNSVVELADANTHVVKGRLRNRSTGFQA